MKPHFVLADDHPLIRRGVSALLREAYPAARVDECDSAAAVLASLRAVIPDLLLLDLSLPDRHGLEVLADLRRQRDATPVLILTMHDDERFALRALELGAQGYLNKKRAADELLGAVRRVLAGGRFIGEDTAELLAGRAFGGHARAHELLSPREFRVLRELARGATTGDIAARLHVSPKTVSTYRARLLDKLGLSSNADLTRYCLDHGLID